MDESAGGKKKPKKRSNLIIGQKFFLISLVLLIVILIGGSLGFIYSMSLIVHANKEIELLQTSEIQRYSLEASVNREISIALDMANSPIIIQHFLNPNDQALRRIAFDEITRFTRSLMSKSAFWVNDIDKEFYLGEDTHYTLDPDDPDNYWYNMTMYDTPVYNFNINYNPDLQVTNFWINAPVFDSGGNPIGILGTGINLTEFVNIIYSNYSGDASLYFFNSAGEITGATDMDLVADKVNIDRVLAATGPQILSWVRNMSPETTEHMRAFNGPEGEIAVCAIPVVGWYIASVQPLELRDYLGTSMTPLFIAIMFIIIIFFVILQVGKYAMDTISQTRQELRIERDLIATMKDNLSVGLFLMDGEYKIQGSYSKPLEKILGTEEIEGRKFTDFLTASLRNKELESINDYFEMVIKRQYDAKMLDEINPISEFMYIDKNAKSEKMIKTVFNSVDMGSNNLFIMGNMEDISATKELERQLAEEAGKREEEMRTLFQVIQIDSAVFNDFIEDVDFEFNKVNETLKDKSISGKDALVIIYQSVHAIKSNATILGLENFSSMVHTLEDTIKKFRDNDDVTFDNILHVTVELEKIMREKDKFQNVTEKIVSFKTTSGSTRQGGNVLIETLSKACDKAAEAMNKKAKLVVDNLDMTILDRGPRREIKEILTQLVRNAVYHGIETPEERKISGKTEEGTVRLVITGAGNKIHIKLSDDGKGLDLNRIREKALRLNLLTAENAGKKGNLMNVIFAPGFSTAETADVHAGRGIGLNLVRDRIKHLNGAIKLSSESGKGTVFQLDIPVA